MYAQSIRRRVKSRRAWSTRGTTGPALMIAAIANLTFEEPDERRFPGLSLARHALQSGGGAPTILSAANEIAVHGFLAGKVGFLDIVRIVERALEKVPRVPLESLEDVRAIDSAAREIAASMVDPRDDRARAHDR